MANEALLDIHVQDNVTVVSLDTASITTAGIDPIARTLRTLVSQQHPESIVIDFTQVCFISSLMIGLLVDLWRRMKEYGGCLCICGINPQFNRVFRITHLDRIFRFCPDVKAAVDSLKV